MCPSTTIAAWCAAGPALVVGGLALQQLWLFWVAPILGGLLGGFVYKELNKTAG